MKQCIFTHVMMGVRPGTTIKELTWTCHTLGLALSHTCAFVVVDPPTDIRPRSKQSALWLEIKDILISPGHLLSWPIVILDHFLKGKHTP